jgi:hypothetical protein
MICQHGQLQRQCELCDKDAEIERLTALFEATRFDKRQHAEALDEIERLKELLGEVRDHMADIVNRIDAALAPEDGP